MTLYNRAESSTVPRRGKKEASRSPTAETETNSGRTESHNLTASVSYKEIKKSENIN